MHSLIQLARTYSSMNMPFYLRKMILDILLFPLSHLQTYHREILEHMPPPPVKPVIRRPPPVSIGRPPPPVSKPHIVLKSPPVKRNPSKRGRSDKRSSSKRHRKVIAAHREENLF